MWGQSVIYNSQVISLLPPDKTADDPFVQTLQKYHVLLLSIVSFFARIVTGVIADLASKCRIHKMWWAIFASFLTFAGFGLGQYLRNVEELIILSAVISVSYGAVWTIIPILTGEFFGFANFGKNWGWMTVLPAFGGQAFGVIYGFNSRAGGEDTGMCRGVHCFQYSFFAASMASLMVLIVNVILLFKRKCYSYDHATKAEYSSRGNRLCL